MSLFLCHECYTWVEPRDGRCPDCEHNVDPSVPDPPIGDLSRQIGPVAERVGEVVVKRRKLPDRGTLYTTALGLLFVPHQPVTETRMVEAEAGSSLLWTLASFAFTPLIFLLPFMRSKRLEPSLVNVLRPVRLTRGDADRPAELLMENPGVFFVPQRSIYRVRGRRKKWRIERRHGSAVKVRPVEDATRFRWLVQEAEV